MKRWEFNQSVLSLLVLLVVGFAQGRTQELKQCALRAFVSLGGSLICGGPAGGSRVDQLPQRLSFDGGVLGDELCECAGVVNKGIPPSFEVVKKVASRGRLAIDVGELRFNGRGVDLAHQFADKLHLSTSSFMLFIRNITVGFKCLTQLVFWEFNLSKLLFGQRGQRLAERLKRKHFAFFCAFRRLSVELFVGQIVIL